MPKKKNKAQKDKESNDPQKLKLTLASNPLHHLLHMTQTDPDSDVASSLPAP